MVSIGPFVVVSEVLSFHVQHVCVAHVALVSTISTAPWRRAFDDTRYVMAWRDEGERRKTCRDPRGRKNASLVAPMVVVVMVVDTRHVQVKTDGNDARMRWKREEEADGHVWNGWTWMWSHRPPWDLPGWPAPLRNNRRRWPCERGR